MFKNTLLKTFTKTINNIEYKTLVYSDRIEWRVNGNLHRDNDRPAVKFKNGSEFWYKNGLLHRDNDKPAMITKNLKEWYINGHRHRKGKPAILFNNSNNENNYFINGKKLTKEEIIKSKKIINF